MTYRGHPFPAGTDDLPTQEAIVTYLHNHSEKYLHYIRFNRFVQRVRWTDPSGKQTDGQKKWTVEWLPSIQSLEEAVQPSTVEQFDYVVVVSSLSHSFVSHIIELHFLG